MDPGPYPTRWGPSSPGNGRAATVAGPSLSGDREAASPLASAATATGVNLATQTPQATTTSAPVPSPHLHSRERAPCPPARSRGLSGARGTRGAAGPWESLSVFLVSMRSRTHFGSELRFSGFSPRGAEEAGKAQDWVAASGAEPNRTSGLDKGVL